MSTYSAIVQSEGPLWVVRVEGVGVTQAHSLEEAEAMARDLVHLMTGESEADVALRTAADCDAQTRARA